MKLFKLISHFFSKIKPRYTLSLDSHYFCLTKKAVVYRFKVFGEHSFPKLTFEEIKNDKNLLHDINSQDLMKIATDEYAAQQRKSMLTISEILRDNRYKLADNETEEVLSGDEICDNILLIEKIKNIDLYKIAYNTGFNHGRKVAREIINKSDSHCRSLPNNVIPLMVVDNDI